MARKKNFEVPYDPETGDLCEGFVRSYGSNGKVAWGRRGRVDNPRLEPNNTFDATLQFEGLGWKGKSVWLNLSTGSRLYMFPTELEELLLKAESLKGVVTARWIIRNRGGYFGVGLAGDDEY